MKRILALILYYSFATWLPDSYLPIIGSLSNSIRVLLCRQIFRDCGRGVVINRKAYFGSGKDIEFGDFSSIGAESTLPNDIKIGKYVMMSPKVHIVTNNHYFNQTDIPMCLQGSPEIHKRTFIDDDCWIGVNSIFTPGRHIKEGSIVAAGAVVTKDFDKYSIIGGNPAKLIKCRL